ncbi:MAG: hypothetical protein WA954_04035 [Parerythrobacter sp.]
MSNQPPVSLDPPRIASLLALAIPVAAGAAWMWVAKAPAHFPIVNLAALALAALWLWFGRGPHTATSRGVLFAALLIIMLSPLVIGPEVRSITGDAVSRWVSLGPVALHTGMLFTPALAILAAHNTRFGPAMLVLAMFTVLLQPDAATGFALTFAAVGIHHVTRNWQFGVVAIIGFVASIAMALTGEVKAQPFVERVLIDAAQTSILFTVLLALTLLASFCLLLFAVPLSRGARFALAGTLFGFIVMALISYYPMPLVGYGAAPILGFGLAMGLHGIRTR